MLPTISSLLNSVASSYISVGKYPKELRPYHPYQVSWSRGSFSMFQPTFIVPNCHHPLLCYRQYHPPSIRWHHHIYLLGNTLKNCDRITLIRWVGVEAHFPCFSPFLMYRIVIIFYYVTGNIIPLKFCGIIMFICLIIPQRIGTVSPLPGELE